jgi:hypothetical protein
MNDYLPEYYDAKTTDDMECLYDDRELERDPDLDW